MKRKLFSSGAKWEDKVGYSRAVRFGNTIEVSGSTSIKDGKLVGEGDVGLQTKTTLDIIETAIIALGGKLEDVVRTRMYTTDISLWEEIGEVHGAYFKTIKPATSLIEISGLIDPKMLIEIEATAIVQD